MSMLSWVRSINELSKFMGDDRQEVHLTTDKNSIYLNRTIKIGGDDLVFCFFELREIDGGLELRVNGFDKDSNLSLAEIGEVDQVCAKVKKFVSDLKGK